MAESKLIRNLLKTKIGFIGGGNMAFAIASGLVKKDVIKANNICVSARSERSFTLWKELGAHTTLHNEHVIVESELIILAMKPQMLDEALSTIKLTRCDGRSKIIISVLVGVTVEALENKLSDIVNSPKVVRVMPNTAVIVGEGITVCCSKPEYEEEAEFTRELFSHLGIAEIVPESQMNAIGGLSGSGPAYAYLITEALADGAVRMGVPRGIATKFAAQVLVGASKMVLETGKHPGQLKDEVCSPGGTTITGIHELERGGVRASLMNAVEAAANRSSELSSAHK